MGTQINKERTTEGNTDSTRYYQYGVRNMNEIVYSAAMMGRELADELLEMAEFKWEESGLSKSDSLYHIGPEAPDREWVYKTIGKISIGFMEEHHDYQPEDWDLLLEGGLLKTYILNWARRYFDNLINNKIQEILKK